MRYPRIPLPPDIKHFHKLSALGQELIDWHLLKASQSQIAPTGSGEHRCAIGLKGKGKGLSHRVRYVDGSVWINPTQHFTDVPIDVWEYESRLRIRCVKNG